MNIQAANPMIQAAIDSGQDTTGLCTVRGAVASMLEANVELMEMFFQHQGKGINVEIKITRVVESMGQQKG